MEILFGLAIATVLAIGWFYGNLFVCVFLTLGSLCGSSLGILLVATATHRDSTDATFGWWLILATVVALGIAWAPRRYRQHTAP